MEREDMGEFVDNLSGLLSLFLLHDVHVSSFPQDIHTSCDSAHIPDCGHLLHMYVQMIVYTIAVTCVHMVTFFALIYRTCFKNMVSNG